MVNHQLWEFSQDCQIHVPKNVFLGSGNPIELPAVRAPHEVGRFAESQGLDPLAARRFPSFSISETPWICQSDQKLIQIMDLEMSRTLGWPQLTPAKRSAALASVGSKGLKLHSGSRNFTKGVWMVQTSSLMVNLEYTQHFAGDFGESLEYTCLGHTVKNVVQRWSIDQTGGVWKYSVSLYNCYIQDDFSNFGYFSRGHDVLTHRIFVPFPRSFRPSHGKLLIVIMPLPCASSPTT